jgi:putative DNA methylase
VSQKRKLIEVALPLEAINKESAREKSIRHGHPSTLHLWWARRPLAACRAVIFASIVDDPSSHPEQFPTDAAHCIKTWSWSCKKIWQRWSWTWAW